MERATFSPLWHRVRALKPRLRPHVQVTRQHYRGRRWHVAHDPASNQFFRLSPVAYEMVGLLDGTRAVEEVWNISLGNHGDAAPTQGEVIELLGQMYNSNLLAIDTTPETEQLLSRGRERLKRRISQQAIGIMYFRVKLFNPDRYLTWLEPILRPLINGWGFLFWGAWIIWALVRIAPYGEAIQDSFRNVIDPTEWFSVFVVFVIIKAIHETGHGIICKRFGGQVPEFGAMLLVLLPSPYVDASATWAFPSKWRRMAVGAGGMIFELAVAAAAAHYWIATLGDSGSMGHKLAFNAMFTASVTTVLFNANPLMRFDGYYILSDLLEVPNLMQRSTKMLQHLAQKYIYRVEQTRPPATTTSEQVTLVIYGVLAMAYRVFLFFSITLYMMGKLFAIGLILAVWTAAAWFILPIGKFIHWLATSSQLSEFRARAILTSLVLITVGVIGLGLVPVPDRYRVSGVVQSEARSGVFFETDGFVTKAHVQPGDFVKKGDPIVTCESDDMTSRMAIAEAQLREYESLERQYTRDSPAAAVIARERLANQKHLISEVRKRIDGLVLRAPHDGVVVLGVHGMNPQTVVGAYIRRGQMLCEIVDESHVRVAAPLTTAQAEPLIQTPPDKRHVEIRAISNPDDVIYGTSLRVIEAGQKALPHAALSYGGGGSVETDPQDKTGMTARNAQFLVYVDAPNLGAPGERVRLRVSLPWRPLLWQWVERVERMIQGRVDI